MRLLKRDAVATGIVAAALILYVLCATEITPSSSTGVRATGIGVLALGFVASATAVVPSITLGIPWWMRRFGTRLNDSEGVRHFRSWRANVGRWSLPSLSSPLDARRQLALAHPQWGQFNRPHRAHPR